MRLLYTAFEPSGDALAAALIAAVREREPGAEQVALGGPAMQDAGAVLLEQTTHRAAMGLGAAAQALDHRRRIARLRAYLKEHEIDALIPTDSPAANWAACSAVRSIQPRARIVHLVAPQLWAWAPWRVRRMRRLSDRVMCLLPFEPDWFGQRGVRGDFVGHPLFQNAPPPPREIMSDLPRLALLPGSRASEVAANWPTMLEVLERLRSGRPNLRALLIAADVARAEQAATLTDGGLERRGIELSIGRASQAMAGCDAGLIVSGTASLHALSCRLPCVVIYNASRLGWELAKRTLVQTRTFALPNLIAEWQGLGRVVPEFVPHHGAVEPVAAAVAPLLEERMARWGQLNAFERIAETFASVDFGEAASGVVMAEVLGRSRS